MLASILILDRGDRTRPSHEPPCHIFNPPPPFSHALPSLTFAPGCVSGHWEHGRHACTGYWVPRWQTIRPPACLSCTPTISIILRTVPGSVSASVPPTIVVQMFSLRQGAVVHIQSASRVPSSQGTARCPLTGMVFNVYGAVPRGHGLA